MKKQELIIFIGVIIFIALLFLIYTLTSLFSSPEPIPSPSPSVRPSINDRPFPSESPTLTPPSPVALPSSLPPSTNQITLQELVSLMPIQTDFANIEYLSVSNSFAITIKKNPYSENRTKVEEWFRSQGFNPSELDIYWQTYPEVITE